MSVTSACPTLLSLLDDFYQAVPGHCLPDASVVDGGDIPEPYRRLLVHNSDMTSTLEKYHGEKIALRVLERKLTSDWLARHIVLEGMDSGRPVEYGAIRINLGALDHEVQEQVFECRDPLGGILNQHGVQYGSCPGAFFRVHSSELMNRVLGLDRPRWLYGRCNCLADLSGRTIAEVVEVLPPMAAPGREAEDVRLQERGPGW
jgi:hypothetical protein